MESLRKSNRSVWLEFSTTEWEEGMITQEIREETGPDFDGPL